MMTDFLVEIHWVRCGRAFVPSRDDLCRGAEWYRRCPDCRPAQDDIDGVLG